MWVVEHISGEICSTYGGFKTEEQCNNFIWNKVDPISVWNYGDDSNYFATEIDDDSEEALFIDIRDYKEKRMNITERPGYEQLL